MSELVKVVKQALKEIDEEKLHANVHGRIMAKLSKETPIGKYGMAQCGICEQVFEYTNHPIGVSPSTEKGSE